MQSLRSAGMRLDWLWKNKDIGWVCQGFIDDYSACELRPTQDPLVGVFELNQDQLNLALSLGDMPEKFKKILRAPMDETKTHSLYEIPLETTAMRDLFSDLVEALIPAFEAAKKG